MPSRHRLGRRWVTTDWCASRRMGRAVAKKVRCVGRFEPYPARKLRRSTARNLTVENRRLLAVWLPPEYVPNNGAVLVGQRLTQVTGESGCKWLIRRQKSPRSLWNRGHAFGRREWTRTIARTGVRRWCTGLQTPSNPLKPPRMSKEMSKASGGRSGLGGQEGADSIALCRV